MRERIRPHQASPSDVARQTIIFPMVDVDFFKKGKRFLRTRRWR